MENHRAQSISRRWEESVTTKKNTRLSLFHDPLNTSLRETWMVLVSGARGEGLVKESILTRFVVEGGHVHPTGCEKKREYKIGPCLSGTSLEAEISVRHA